MDTNGINYSEVPTNYAHCLAGECPLAPTCLRSLAWQALPKDEPTARVLNPAQVTCDAGCPHYRDSTPVLYAIGFTRMQQRMYPDQYAEFSARLTARFGRTPYFMRRSGKRPLPPSEQKYIRAVLKAVGAPADLDFDRYEERLLWTE